MLDEAVIEENGRRGYRAIQLAIIINNALGSATNDKPGWKLNGNSAINSAMPDQLL